MKVLIYGASDNPQRYAYLACRMLLDHGHEVHLLGLKKAQVFDIPILGPRHLSDIDTVTLYVGPKHQESLLEYLSALAPRRVIFNPGTENPELMQALERRGIQALEACTLVLLQTGQF